MTKRMQPEEKRYRAEWRKLVRRLHKKFGALGLVSEPIRKMIAAEVIEWQEEQRRVAARRSKICR